MQKSRRSKAASKKSKVVNKLAPMKTRDVRNSIASGVTSAAPKKS